MGISPLVLFVDMHMKWHEKVNMYVFVVNIFVYLQVPA
jgi:hypothetical protein